MRIINHQASTLQPPLSQHGLPLAPNQMAALSPQTFFERNQGPRRRQNGALSRSFFHGTPGDAACG